MTGPAGPGSTTAALAELSRRLARCPDLDTLVDAALCGLDELFGYAHAQLLLLDEQGEVLYTIASHGYAAEGVGSEVRVGEGIVGMAAARAVPMRVGNLGRMLAYARRVRRAYEAGGAAAPGHEVPLPGLPDAQSQVAVPAMVLGQLVGVLAVESATPMAYGADDEALLTVVATLVASSIEIDRAQEAAAPARLPEPPADRRAPRPAASGGAPALHVRFYPVDGSTFLDGEYLIKGVAGRVLWKLLGHHVAEGRGEFTNRELRLDPALELPELRDNLESRLILLKRRLEERGAPVRIEKAGRGRFRLVVSAPVALEAVGEAGG